MVALALCTPTSVSAQIGAFGVMIDSLGDDEYFEESYGTDATSWVPQLATYRSVNVGPTANAQSQHFYRVRQLP